MTGAGVAIGDATAAAMSGVSGAMSDAGATLAAVGNDAGASISSWWSRAKAAVVATTTKTAGPSGAAHAEAAKGDTSEPLIIDAAVMNDATGHKDGAHALAG